MKVRIEQETQQVLVKLQREENDRLKKSLELLQQEQMKVEQEKSESSVIVTQINEVKKDESTPGKIHLQDKITESNKTIELLRFHGL